MQKLLLFFGILFLCVAAQAQVIVNDSPYPLIECDDNNDGIASFDLHQADPDITMGHTSLFITYHTTVHDAETNINALLSPYMNTTPYSELVYARVMDNLGVFAIVELELRVVDTLPITQPIDLFQIDDDEDGLAIFDLTANNAIVLEGLNPSTYLVSYYESEENAEMDVYAIADPTSYQNIQNPQTIYVRIANMSANCVAMASFRISTESLSIDSLWFENLRVYPNPTSGNLTIQSSQLVSVTTISLYDILGKMVLSEEILPQNKALTLNISSFKSGVYFVKISAEGNVAVRKLVKE